MRNALRAAQGNRCAVCGKMLGSLQPTFEHVTPVHAGGGSRRNLLLTHFACNQQRGDAMPTGCLLIMLDAVNARLGL